MGPSSRVLELRRGESSNTTPGIDDHPEQAGTSHASVPAVLRSPSGVPSYRYTHTRVIQPDANIMERNRIIAGQGPSPAINAYKVLRTQVLQRMHEHGWLTLGVTSPRGNAGKTLTAINLAIAIARDVSHSALLVDFDLAQPAIAKLFGYKPEYGLDDLILGAATLEATLFHPCMGRLVVMPGRGTLTTASELITAPHVTDLVIDMKNRYSGRIVVFDLPAVLEGDEVLAMAPQVDAFLMVIDERRTIRRDLERALELLPKEKLIGTMLNRATS